MRTMTPSVLWYVHDQGTGHLRRAASVIARMDAPVVVASGPEIAVEMRQTFGHLPTVSLPSDVPGGDGPIPRTVGPWHFAPAGDATTARAGALIDTIRTHRCTTAVVDVSMEVTALMRLAGLRVVTVRQSGSRGDAAHRTGFASADVVWVPQHPDLEPVDRSVEDVDGRWQFTGAFSRFDVTTGTSNGTSTRHAASSHDRPAEDVARRRTVLFLVGRGGTSLHLDPWRTTAAPAGWRVVIAGSDVTFGSVDGHVRAVGRVDDVGALVAAADVVVTSAGWASVAEAASLRRRLVVIPEVRPFDEQLIRARALEAAGLALCLDAWPEPDTLTSVLHRADRLDPARWERFTDGQGAGRAASMIDDVHGGGCRS